MFNNLVESLEAMPIIEQFFGAVAEEDIVKPGKSSIFLKNGKTVISVENLKIF